jgi:hypothetical protein
VKHGVKFARIFWDYFYNLSSVPLIPLLENVNSVWTFIISLSLGPLISQLGGFLGSILCTDSRRSMHDVEIQHSEVLQYRTNIESHFIELQSLHEH